MSRVDWTVPGIAALAPCDFVTCQGMRWRVAPGLMAWAIVWLTAGGCSERPAAPPKQRNAQVIAAPVRPEDVRPQVEAFCGACHLPPHPESFPRDRWPQEVQRGYDFYLASGRSDLDVPRRADVVSFYEQQAPEALRLKSASDRDEKPGFEKRNEDFALPVESDLAIAHVTAMSNPQDASASLVAYCDMRCGTVAWASLGAETRIVQRASLPHPSHVRQTDLDGDGTADFVAADLGSFLPEDHNRGQVVWLRPKQTTDGGDFDSRVLLDGVGRVAAVEPGDFDGDGDIDVVVAAFGLHSTGNVLLLRQGQRSPQGPTFTSELLDPRTGAIHVPAADLNGDGHLDFVVLLSQEHESIEAFINRGPGVFDKQVLYRAPDPSYGSSGIHLVDLDRDDDLDIIYTNGDTFDSFYVKPYYGVRWIENRGAGEWKTHLVATLPGAFGAKTGDLDADGDLDIAVSCFLSPSAVDRLPPGVRCASLVWLESSEEGFKQHNLELDNCTHAALELADVNGDAALDIIVGNFGALSGESVRPLDVWINLMGQRGQAPK